MLLLGNRRSILNKQFLFVTVLALVSLITVSCTCGGFSEPPFSGPPGEPQPGEPMVFFTADRTSIQPGECVTLEWQVEGEGFFGVELDGQPVNPSGHQQVCPGETGIYTLGVDLGDAILNREVFVSVAGTGQPPPPPPPPPGPGQPPQPPQQPQPSSQGCLGAPLFTHFEANPSFVVAGQATTLEWGPVTNGTSGQLVGSVVLTPGNFGEVGSPGSRQVSPTTPTTYTLTATGCGGTATKSVTVSVGPPGGGSWSGPSPNPPGGGSWSGPAKVTNVTAQAIPPSYTGVCPKTFNFSADITVDGPCTVTYRWERSDGATGPVVNLVFSAAGTKTVTNSWQLIVGLNVTYWERVSILTPLPMMSNQAAFTFTCTP